ncbi:MAG: hypothetical protein AAF630_16695 [Cyanobacteria bacterium P01_C01_bin.38]
MKVLQLIWAWGMGHWALGVANSTPSTPSTPSSLSPPNQIHAHEITKALFHNPNFNIYNDRIHHSRIHSYAASTS